MKLGILRETTRSTDRRVPVTPETGAWIRANFPQIGLVVQRSEVRAHPDDEYRRAGIAVVDDLSDCDVLLGVKEVDPQTLFEGKTYFMFAHVAKGQIGNQAFLAALSRKKITLIDYEYLTDLQNNRLAAFGFWAGVAGGYYAFQGIARRFGGVQLPSPEQCSGVAELHRHLGQLAVPALKIVLTGGGRVAAGALSIIRELGITEVSVRDFLDRKFEHGVFCRLDPENYAAKPDGSFNLDEFYHDPTGYISAFGPFARQADVFIPCHFWDSRSPGFFTPEQAASPDFRISLVADISCDLNGPIPTTIRASSIEQPFYDIDPATMRERKAFSGGRNITVMAVDNLPSALPVDASRSFSRDLYDQVLPALLGDDRAGILERATILKGGKLTERYAYLTNFLEAGLADLPG